MKSVKNGKRISEQRGGEVKKWMSEVDKMRNQYHKTRTEHKQGAFIDTVV